MDELMLKTMEERSTADGELVLSNKYRSMLHLPPKRKNQIGRFILSVPFLFDHSEHTHTSRFASREEKRSGGGKEREILAGELMQDVSHPITDVSYSNGDH